MNRFDTSVPEVKCTVNNKDELNQIPSNITHLEIAPHCCCDSDLTELDLSGYGLLKSVVIGENSLKNVVSIKESPLLRLGSIDYPYVMLSVYVNN